VWLALKDGFSSRTIVTIRSSAPNLRASCTARDVLTPLLCRKSMISRMTFCSAQPAMIRSARFGPIPVTSRNRCGSCWMTSKTVSPNARTSFLA